jgi:membrane associated rhomboid family serine protease
MIGLSVCFAVQQIVIVHKEKPYDAYLALSGYGMKSGHLWELLTYQCLHRGPLHWLLNLAGLWFLGRAVEHRLGAKKFLGLYLGAVLAGAVLQSLPALAGYVLPEALESVAGFLRERFGDMMAGSSVGLCGVLAVFCRLKASAPLWRCSRFPIQANHLLGFALSLAVLLVLVPTDPRLAHVAHLGGLLAGLAFCQWCALAPSPTGPPVP